MNFAEQKGFAFFATERQDRFSAFCFFMQLLYCVALPIMHAACAFVDVDQTEFSTLLTAMGHFGISMCDRSRQEWHKYLEAFGFKVHIGCNH